MPENIIESLLNKTAEETGADPQSFKTETTQPTNTPEVKTEVKTDPTPEPKVEGKEQVKTEPIDQTPWYKELEFEDEVSAKEFVKTAKTKQPEKPKFANSEVEAYNAFIENGGPADYGVYQAVKKFQVSDNPTPEEMIKAIVLKQTLEDPDYKGKEHLLEKKLNREFKLDMDKELAEEDEKEEAEMKLIDLKKEFKKASGYFTELQKKSEVKVDETLQTRLKEGPDKLKNHLDNLLKDFKLDVKELVKGEKGEEKFGENSIYSVIFDESMQKTHREIYESIAKDKGYPDLSEGIHNEINEVSMAIALAKKFPHVANDLFKAGREFERNANVKKEIEDTNPSSVGTHTKTNTSMDVDDKSGDIFGK